MADRSLGEVGLEPPSPIRRGLSIGWNARTVAASLAILVVVAVGALALLSEGTLLVESSPAGAEVLIGGQSQGTTPLTLRTRLASIAGTLEVRLAGYEPQQLAYALEPRQNGRLQATLVAQRGELEINSQPPGAQAYFDGNLAGTTPLALADVSPGEHSLRLTLADHREWTQQVAVGPGDRAVIEATLSALPGSIHVSSAPSEAAVSIDGQERGITPITLGEIAPGEHVLKVAKQGFVEWQRSVSVGPNAQLDIEVQLVRSGNERADFARPLAVMIDNHSCARPQSGLSTADVVYEALAEGGVTRFMGLFATRSVDVIGPVRSGRHYFVYWADEYDAVYVHCGAYPEAYDAIRATGIADLDDLLGDPGFWRSSAREAPHNLYTSTSALREAADGKGYRRDLGSFGGLSFRQQPQPASGDEAHRIVLSYPHGYYVVWEYDAASNAYLRYTMGAPHVDANTGEQLRASSLVVLRMSNWFIGRDDQQDFKQVGSGEAIFFMDGRAREGTWTRESLDAPTYLWDEAGERVLLNGEGTTWIQVIPPDAPVDYE